jgi:hypothetical protein
MIFPPPFLLTALRADIFKPCRISIVDNTLVKSVVMLLVTPTSTTGSLEEVDLSAAGTPITSVVMGNHLVYDFIAVE